MVLTDPYGQLMSNVTTNTAGANQAQVPDAENIIIQAVEKAGGTVTVTAYQQLPGSSALAPRGSMALTANEVESIVIPAPIGLILVFTTGIAGATVDVFYGAHYPR